MENNMEELAKQLSRLSTQDERIDLLEMALTEHAPTADDTRLPLTLGNVQNFGKSKRNKIAESSVDQILAFGTRYDSHSLLADRIVDRLLNGLLPYEEKWSYPILKLPCANMKPDAHQKCPETGIHACSGCLLVSYCSKVGFYRP
jgi:hypothetical protein